MFDGMCGVTQTDFAKGFTTLTMLSGFVGIDDVRVYYPDGIDATVAGLPAFIVGPDLYVETSAGPITFSAVLSDDAAASGMDPDDITVPVAELVVAAIEEAE
jgi:hypothetical protein